MMMKMLLLKPLSVQFEQRACSFAKRMIVISGGKGASECVRVSISVFVA